MRAIHAASVFVFLVMGCGQHEGASDSTPERPIDSPTAPSLPRDERVAITPIPMNALELEIQGFSGAADMVSGKWVQFSTVQKALVHVLGNLDLRVNSQSVLKHFDLSSKTSGLMLFTDRLDMIGNHLSFMVSHQKLNMNLNRGGLDMVLAIDTSLSMKHYLPALSGAVAKLSHAIAPIVRSGRVVRLGAVSFEEPGKEQIEIPLTENFNCVSEALLRLTHHHKKSKIKGSGTFSGIQFAVKNMDWSQANRMVVLITNNESWEMNAKIEGFNGFAFAESVVKLLKAPENKIVGNSIILN